MKSYTLKLNERELDIMQSAISYLKSNLDDVSDALDSVLDRVDVEQLETKVYELVKKSYHQKKGNSTTTHYIGMAGVHGCIPQYCASYKTIKDAVEDLAQVHELSERKRRILRKDLYLEMDLHTQGNEYCQVTECDCNEPEIHNDN